MLVSGTSLQLALINALFNTTIPANFKLESMATRRGELVKLHQ